MASLMRGPGEVRDYFKRYFRAHYRDWLHDTESVSGSFPLRVLLKPPTALEAMRATEGVRGWIKSWKDLPPDLGEVSWQEVNWRYLGRQMLPLKLSVPDPETVARWAGQEAPFERARGRFARAVGLFPDLLESMPGCHHELFDMAGDDFQRLLDMLAWLESNPDSDLFPRELPVAGLDSKWLETHKKSVSALASPILDTDASGGSLYPALGLKTPPKLLRLRLLDPGLRAAAGGLGDLSAPVGELAGLNIKPKLAIIVENLQTGLSVKDLKGAVLFMRMGYSVDMLGGIPWLQGIKCVYWGDLDTHGFAILSRARKHLPEASSILMDLKTLLAYKELWGRENTPFQGRYLPYLTREEDKVFQGLLDNRWGENIRLEQERIAWETAWPLLQKAAE
jgi:hypothetical protein